MLAIAGVTATSLPSGEQPAGRRSPQTVASGRVAPTTGTALVAVAPATARGQLSIAGGRPVAAFVAHLIATRQLAPQTRARRRANPAEAVAAYRAADHAAKACAPLRNL